MIQSTKPASMSGMSVLMPSPAGVSAPVSVIADRDIVVEHALREQPAPSRRRPPL
jgi:hypothetical protein